MYTRLLTDLLPTYLPYLRRSARHKVADQEITKQQFVVALKALNERLKAEKKTFTFLLVGGGAMMLALNARQATHDLDGTLLPADPETTKLFHRLVAEVGREIGIAEDWMNLEVKNIMGEQKFSRSYFEPVSPYEYSNLKLLFGKPAYLLSMKCQAMRTGKKDFADIVSLVKVLGIRSLAGLEEAIEPYGGWDYIGNDEYTLLKLCIAWAFPGETQYEQIRLNALKARGGK